MQAHIALFLVALIYGANYTITKEVINNGYIEPLAFILLRVSCGAVLFFLFHYLFIKEQIARKDLFRLALCGLFGVAINQMFFFSGLYYTKPINASLIMTSTPIIVMLFSSMMLGERITFRRVIGISLGAAGAILLIAFGKSVSFNSSQLKGDMMILINASSYALYLVLVKELMKRYHPLTIVKWIFLFGFCFVVPFGVSGIPEIDWLSFSTSIWMAFIYVLLFTTFLAYLLNAFALKSLNPTTVSIYIYLQPLLASLIALLFAKDELNMVKVISGALIFIGVYLVSFSKNVQKG